MSLYICIEYTKYIFLVNHTTRIHAISVLCSHFLHTVYLKASHGHHCTMVASCAIASTGECAASKEQSKVKQEDIYAASQPQGTVLACTQKPSIQMYSVHQQSLKLSQVP